jgi:threonine/homoserine/homoserine lactone efflux protein
LKLEARDGEIAMSWYGLLAFCAVYVMAVASPGPGIAALVARSLARGTQGAAAFIGGYVVGDLLLFAAAAAGLAAIAEKAHAVFLIVKYAGAAYLVYLGYRLWTAPASSPEAAADDSAESPLRLFLGSLALTLGNPKALIFFVALLPTVVDLPALDLPGFLQIAAAIAVLMPLVLGTYVLAAARARRFFRNPRAMRLLNRGTGVVMAGAAVTVATR